MFTTKNFCDKASTIIGENLFFNEIKALTTLIDKQLSNVECFEIKEESKSGNKIIYRCELEIKTNCHKEFVLETICKKYRANGWRCSNCFPSDVILFQTFIKFDTSTGAYELCSI